MLEEKCMAMPVGGLADIEIEPDDTDVSDTATFVWEIKQDSKKDRQISFET